MKENPNAALEVNALYGEIMRAVLQINDVDVLKKMYSMVKTFTSNGASKEEVITPALQARLDKARGEISRGHCVTLRSQEDVDKYFASL